MELFQFCGESIDSEILKKEKWLQYLWLAEKDRVNLERLVSVSELQKGNHVLRYVERSLMAVRVYKQESWFPYVEQALKWSEVAKAGQEFDRARWREQGYVLEIHNEASADIYAAECAIETSEEDKRIIELLIRTHGLLGQYIRGEVNLATHKPLTALIQAEIVSEGMMKQMLYALNQGVIAAVSYDLWESTKDEIQALIDRICKDDYQERSTLKRLQLLFPAFRQVEVLTKKEEEIFDCVLERSQLWYPQIALETFSRTEITTIFELLMKEGAAEHISFYRFSRNLLYDYEGRRKANIYKKRIMEMCLREYSDNQENGSSKEHVSVNIIREENTLYFDMKFTPVCASLIQFCVEAEKSGIMTYEKNIQTIFDIFGFRRDMFDRLNNEEKYLSTMNDAMRSTKTKLLEYVRGNRIADVGSGGGVLLDMLEKLYPDKEIIGTDISTNVIEALQKKIDTEGHHYKIQKHNFVDGALSERMDTIIFSSILHEVYSYTEYEGKQFNIDAVKTALRNAVDSLTEGGYLLIRDGVLTDSKQIVRLRFKTEEGAIFCKNYLKDFKGLTELRDKEDTWITDKVCLDGQLLTADINLVREELYTYTWGNESYAQEVQEQFGYFILEEYCEYLESIGMEIEVKRQGIEQGYIDNLSPLVELLDGLTWEAMPSYCFLVARKCDL